MSINKLALIRYKTIDHCLQNRFRKWTLDDLIEACSDAIYEYEGITDGISRRTIQLDIQNMRSEKLGYNAPIIVVDRKFYTYEDKNYSITNTPLTRQDLGTLNEVVNVLRQFKGFGYFQELNEMVTKLEDKLYKQQNKGKSYIDFEKNELLKGLNHIDGLHKAILNKKVLEVTYRSFKALQAQNVVIYPYLLKEYRNRLFVLALNRKNKSFLLFALERIIGFVELHNEPYYEAPFDVFRYFDNVIGVTKSPKQREQKVVIQIDKTHAPYVLTKPLHHSQRILREEENCVIFSIDVVWNFELETLLLGFGERIRVLSPRRLKSRIISSMRQSLEKYTDPEKIRENFVKLD